MNAVSMYTLNLVSVTKEHKADDKVKHEGAINGAEINAGTPGDVCQTGDRLKGGTSVSWHIQSADLTKASPRKTWRVQGEGK